jgi:hypothetical protein
MAEEGKEKVSSSIVSDATKGVHDAWEFFFPPTFRLVICMGIVFYIGGGPLIKEFLGLYPGTVASWRSHNISAFLEEYKLTPLVPVIAVFVLAAIAYIWNRFVFVVGSLIPLRVSYYVPKLLVHAFRATDIWVLYPEIESIDMLPSAVDLEIQQAKEGGKLASQTGADYWETESEKIYIQFDFCKFVALWTLCWMVVISVNPPLRHQVRGAGLLVLIATAFAGTIIILRFLYAIEQSWLAKTSAVLLLARVSGRPALAQDDPKRTIILRSIEANRGKGWWWLEFVPSFAFLGMIAKFDTERFVFRIYGKWKLMMMKRER